jgi:hypothetical protein
MEEMFKPEVFNMVLMTMSVMAVFVFVCLLKVEAGYGVAYTKKWGPAVNNKLGWVLMEAPAFIAMVVLWLLPWHQKYFQKYSNIKTFQSKIIFQMKKLLSFLLLLVCR